MRKAWWLSGTCLLLGSILFLVLVWPFGLLTPADTSIQTIPTAPTPPQFEDGESNWLLVVMAAATLVSVSTAFYLYRWRRILLANPKMLVPEELGTWMQGIANSNRILGEHIAALGQSHYKTIDSIATHDAHSNQAISNLTETFLTLQKGLDDRDTEIARLKRGYDAEIFRRFIVRFIRVHQAMTDIRKSENFTNDMAEQLDRLLSDAFAECGVESFEIEPGADFRTATGVADNPKQVATSVTQDAFKIIETLEAGYRLRKAESLEVLVPARVAIYTA